MTLIYWYYFKQGFSFLPRGIHSSSSNRRQITSYQNHQHLPIINNDVTVDNFNIPIQNVSDTQNVSRETGVVPNINNSSSRETLTASASADDFFPRQLIAVSDNAASSNYVQSLDNNDGISQGTTNEQTMELLRPMCISSQRY